MGLLLSWVTKAQLIGRSQRNSKWSKSPRFSEITTDCWEEKQEVTFGKLEPNSVPSNTHGAPVLSWVRWGAGNLFQSLRSIQTSCFLWPALQSPTYCKAKNNNELCICKPVPVPYNSAIKSVVSAQVKINPTGWSGSTSIFLKTFGSTKNVFKGCIRGVKEADYQSC